jgi:WD40 repeat protein
MRPTIVIWDVQTGKRALTLEGISANVLCVAYERAGKRIASTAWDGTVCVWDAVTGKLLQRIAAHSAPAHAVAFSPDGSQLVSVGWDRLGKVWDPESGQLIATLCGHEDQILSVAFRYDGTVLATGGEASVFLWDTASFQSVRRLKTAGAGLLAFTSDGDTLVTAGHDFRTDRAWTFSRWDANTGERRATLSLADRGGLVVADLSVDGRRIFAMSCDPPSPRMGAYDALSGNEVAQADPGLAHADQACTGK